MAPLYTLMKPFYCKYLLKETQHVIYFSSDIEEPTTATISVYAKNRSLFGGKQNETCLGRETIPIHLQLKQKSTERFVLNSDPNSGQSNDFQLLVIQGVYVSRRSQTLLNNTVLFEDYITVHTHSGQSQVSLILIQSKGALMFIRDGSDFGEYYMPHNWNCMILNTRRADHLYM